MMSQPDRNPAADLTDAALPKSEIRTTVSFLLFLHLFGLAVAILGTEKPSQLGLALADVPGLKQYREGLLMNLAYTYYLTRGNNVGGELDIDHSLIATFKKKGEPDVVVELPAPGTWPGLRRHRYRTLARTVAMFGDETIGSPEPLGLLLQSIANSLLKEYQGDSLDLRCQGRLTLPAMGEFDPTNAATFARFRDAYTTTALRIDNQIELLKREPARDTAPPPKVNLPPKADEPVASEPPATEAPKASEPPASSEPLNDKS